MPLFPSPGIAGRIVQSLRNGPLATSALLTSLQQKKDPVTVQAIYKALRQLKKEGIVFVQHQEVTLNMRWLEELEAFTTVAMHHQHASARDNGHFLTMQDGDRIRYAFQNPLQVDAFWNHVLYLLFEAYPQVREWYAYASHCWFLLGRRTEELALQHYMKKRGISYLFTVGHRTTLDRVVARDFDGTQTQYQMRSEPLFRQRPNHLGLVVNVFGPYIIEAHYDKHTTDQLEHFYRTTSSMTPEASSILQGILENSGRISFVIIRHERKARELQKQLGTGFVLPRIKNGSN